MLYICFLQRATRVMHESLLRLYDEATRYIAPTKGSEEVSLELTHFDVDFKRKKKTVRNFVTLFILPFINAPALFCSFTNFHMHGSAIKGYNSIT